MGNMMNYNISVYRYYKTIIIMITMISSSLIMAGCALRSSYVFPEISYTSRNSMPAAASNVSGGTGFNTGTLKIALPMTFECLRYLSLMYIGESSGLFKDVLPDMNGLTVSLDTLDTYDIGFDVELQAVADTGMTNFQLMNSYLSDAVPDIMLIKNTDTDLLAMNNISSAKFDQTYIDEYFSSSNIYPSMIQNGIDGNSLNTLPYYASVKMLYANESVLVDTLGNSLLPDGTKLNYDAFKSISKGITRSSEGIYGYMGLSQLLAYMPATIDSTLDSFMWNGNKFDYSGDGFEKSVSIIRSLISSDCVEDSLNTNQKESLYGNIDPRELNKIGFWIDDSNRLEKWTSINKLKIRRFPIQGLNQITLPLSIYSVAVNSKSELLDDALRFAAYIVFDKDALLFRSRYIEPNGFIPPVKDRIVWDNLVKTQLQGDELYSIYNDMNYAKSVTNAQEDIVSEIYNELYEKYFNDILYNKKSLTALYEEINEEANRITSGE